MTRRIVSGSFVDQGCGPADFQLESTRHSRDRSSTLRTRVHDRPRTIGDRTCATSHSRRVRFSSSVVLGGLGCIRYGITNSSGGERTIATTYVPVLRAPGRGTWQVLFLDGEARAPSCASMPSAQVATVRISTNRSNSRKPGNAFLRQSCHDGDRRERQVRAPNSNAVDSGASG